MRKHINRLTEKPERNHNDACGTRSALLPGYESVSKKPILFSGEMVRAILDGRKTQTRRVMNPEPPLFYLGAGGWYPHSEHSKKKHYVNKEHFLKGVPVDFSPYGQPGHKLWVRETWWKIPEPTPKELRDGADTWPLAAYPATDNNEDYLEWGWKRKPSIHMPRWASRILLTVENIRIERLQDVSEDDAIQEGCSYQIKDSKYFHRSARGAFMLTWNRINAKRGYGWSANPWVWVVTFRRDS